LHYSTIRATRAGALPFSCVADQSTWTQRAARLQLDTRGLAAGVTTSGPALAYPAALAVIPTPK